MRTDQTRTDGKVLRLECSGCGHGMRICGDAPAMTSAFKATCPRCFEEDVYVTAQARPWPFVLH